MNLKLRLGFLFVLCLLVSSVSRAQPSTGTPTFGSFASTPAGTLNLGNLNLNLSIPIVQKAGRGTNFSYSLVYDSSVWYPSVVNGTSTWTPVSNFGWKGGTAPTLGGVTYSTTRTTGTCEGDNGRQTRLWYYVYSNFVYVDRFGTSHPFNNQSATESICTGTGDDFYDGFKATASDGSGYTLDATSDVPGVVYGSSGAMANLIQNNYTDANGNQITISNGVFTDTLGTTALTVSGSATPTSPLQMQYTAPGGSANAKLTYAAYNVKTAFGCTGVSEYSAQNIFLASQLVLADGTSYSFTYEPTPGNSGYVTGRVASITLPTGGTESFTYMGANDGIICSDGSTAALQVQTSGGSGGTWQYSRALQGITVPGPGSTWVTTVADPQGNQTVIDFAEDGTTNSSNIYNMYETQRVVYQGSVAPPNVLSTKIRCFNGNFASCSTATVASPITSIYTYTQLPNGSTRASGVYYNGYSTGSGLVSSDVEYDYGVTLGAAPSTTPIRQTFVSYASLGNGIINRPSSIVVKDGSGNIVSSTSYAYDQTKPTATSGTPQQVSVTGSRGNLTTVTRLPSSSTTLSSTYTYYDTGLLQSATDVNTGNTSFTYGYCGNSFLSSATGPTGFTSQATWNCNGGVQLTSIDANGNQTSSSYTDPYFWRPSSSTDAAGNVTYYSYTPASSGTPASVESDLAFNGGNSAVDAITTFDPLGRTLTSQMRQAPGSSEFDTVSYSYDSLGRLAEKSLPYAASQGQASSSAPGTTISYDALFRKVAVADAGGGVKTIAITQNDKLVSKGPAPTGENTKQRQYEYDGLGRLTSVCELTSVTGSGTCGQNSPQTGFWTKYIYNPLNKIVGVVQNAQAASGSQQTRTFTYDWLGRLASETNPENGKTTYTYDTDTTCGTSKGDLVKKVDAVGNVICVAYDLLHRPTQATYPSGAYSANTPVKHFVYDAATVNGAAMANAKGRLVEAYTGTSASKITDLGFSYSALGQTTAVYEKTPNSGGYFQVNTGYWPNGLPNSLSGIPLTSQKTVPIITYGVDGEGRPYSVSAGSGQNPVLSTIYNSASQVTSLLYGSLDTDIFAYDPNTNRETNYAYEVNGQSVTGALVWNPNGSLGSLAVADPFNSANSQTCSYTHDDLGRTASTSCLAAGTQTPLWAQTFGFDPFGNISKSGNTNFVVGYSPSTNQIASGTTGAVYDLNGNLTSINSDASHQYSWDSDGNQSTVDGISNTYDALDRVVEQFNSGAYTQTLYGPWGNKLALVSGGVLTKAFVPLPGGAKAVFNSTGLAYYRHPDWLGSSRFASTPSRTLYYSGAYAPFGESYSEAGTIDRSFTGQNQDTENGQYDFLYRAYSSVQGRWISPDRAGLAVVRPGNPQTWNRYSYATNRPLNHIDALGMDSGGSDCPPDQNVAPGRAHAMDDDCNGGGSGGGGESPDPGPDPGPPDPDPPDPGPGTDPNCTVDFCVTVNEPTLPTVYETVGVVATVDPIEITDPVIPDPTIPNPGDPSSCGVDTVSSEGGFASDLAMSRGGRAMGQKQASGPQACHKSSSPNNNTPFTSATDQEKLKALQSVSNVAPSWFYTQYLSEKACNFWKSVALVSWGSSLAIPITKPVADPAGVVSTGVVTVGCPW